MFPICCRWCLHSHTLSITNQYHSIRYDSFQFISSSTLSLLYGSHKYDRLSVRLAVGLSIRLSTRQTIFGWMLASMWLNWRISLEYYTSRSYWRRWLCRFYVHPTIWELLPLSGVQSFVFGLAEWLSIIDFYI